MKSNASGIRTILSSPKRVNSDSWQGSLLIPILASLGVGMLAVSSDSFWIDEGLSAIKAVAPSLHEAWQELRWEANTNMHMLLYMAALWAWEKCFGSSEWALRSMNIPFFVFGVTALWSAVPRATRPFVLAFCLVSPFLWFYLNEARPYSMIFGFSAVATAALLDWLHHGKDSLFPWARWAWILSLSLVALTWTHVVGLVFELAVAILFFTRIGWRGLLVLLRKIWGPMMFLAASNLALIGYVLWIKAQGVEANSIGKTTWLGIAYWLYEFAGFAGLGPNRNDLRINPFASLWPHLLPLCLLGLAWSGVLLGCWKNPRYTPYREQGKSLGFFLVFVPLLIFLVIGVWQGARFLPRYATSSYPAFVVVASFLLCSLWAEGGWRRRVGLLLLAGLACSSLSLRLNEIHRKDDYRGVIRWLSAQKIQSEMIWWAADSSTARFYGLKNFTPIFNSTAQDLDGFARPSWIIVSKRDIYDSQGSLTTYLLNERAERKRVFRAFEVFYLAPIPLKTD